ncbi:putative NUDIX hydrolase [Tetraselmis virus 1]|uniref:Putative NUDIX hydrolase n=1 Tax=Tetraselmis virus 1 TaxID=2060617 RepID=A0A2P0VMY1_9VIRU|nr:putative NUDIX hydrolase [Tetraselmis virus 1]AUF82251.1 putative NUDIX hydrolase [Tetraselmis virus 1]
MKTYHRMVCSNCGEKGHIFRECSKPITSCGVICYRTSANGDTEYLIVQRRHSYAFVEFIRGKYSLNKKSYVLHLLEGMTVDERNMLRQKNFNVLWKYLWSGYVRGRPKPEKTNSFHKFNCLITGVYYDNKICDLDSMLLETEERCKKETEWGFPKGRKNTSRESDISCALREMNEETGICKENVIIHEEMVFQETFLGDNGVTYKHLYYLCRLHNSDVLLTPCDREINQIKWVTKPVVIEKFIDYPTRIELFDKVCNAVVTPRQMIGVSTS